MASLVFSSDDDAATPHHLDPEQPVTIGRLEDNVLHLPDGSVSSHHAVLTRRNDVWYLQDLGSSNGTRVNGAPIEEAMLVNGDHVSFGHLHAIFYLKDQDAAAAVEDQSAVAVELAENEPVRRRPPEPVPRTRPRLPANRLKMRGGRAYPGTEGSPVLATVMMIGVCLFGAVLGLALRHQHETGRNFFSDAFKSISGDLPRITIEKKAGP